MSARPEPIRWAIMGTGMIAEKVLPLLRAASNAEITAIASRDVGRARVFADAHSIDGACTYDGLLARDDIDAIYLTLPNHLHVPWSIRLLEAGKHVLCEKPLTPFKGEAQRIADTARETGSIFTEGFMYLHHPQMRKLIEIARAGDAPDSIIGPLKRIDAGSCMNLLERPNIHTRLSHAMQGGAIMDLGVYPISIARVLTGEEPGTVTAAAAYAEPQPGEDKAVDVSAAFHFDFPSGVTFDGACAIDQDRGIWLDLVGEWGRVRTDLPFRPDPKRAVLKAVRFDEHPNGAGRDEIIIEDGGDRFTNQFEDFGRVIQERLGPDATTPSLDFCVGQAAAIEHLHRAINIRFQRQHS